MTLCETNRLGLKVGDTVHLEADLVIKDFWEQHETGIVMLYLENKNYPGEFAASISPQDFKELQKHPDKFCKAIKL